VLSRTVTAGEAAAPTQRTSSELTLERLVKGYGIPLGRLVALEDMGIIRAVDADHFHCDDEDCLIIVAAAIQLGFTLRELRELMELYADASPARRALPTFMKLLASYQRLMAWRHPEAGGSAPPTAERQRRPFRARDFRPDIVCKDEPA
jgi:DNA-binding transcriptional MerR regulator